MFFERLDSALVHQTTGCGRLFQVGITRMLKAFWRSMDLVEGLSICFWCPLFVVQRYIFSMVYTHTVGTTTLIVSTLKLRHPTTLNPHCILIVYESRNNFDIIIIIYSFRHRNITTLFQHQENNVETTCKYNKNTTLKQHEFTTKIQLWIYVIIDTFKFN